VNARIGRMNLWPTRPAACGLILLSVSTGFAQEGPQPDIGISLRGVADDIIEQGEPLHVAVSLVSEDGDLALAPARGSWADAVHVEILAGGSENVRAGGQSAGQPQDPVARINRYRMAEGTWRFPADVTQSLSPGHYRVRARLAIATAAPTGGWTGEVSSQEMPLDVVAPSADPLRREQGAVSRAYDAMQDNRLEDAASILDALLAEQPDSVDGWLARSDVSERAGNPAAAMLCLNHAQALSADDGLDSSAAARWQELQGNGEDDAPRGDAQYPEWTWPPAAFAGPLPPPLENPPVFGPDAATAAATTAVTAPAPGKESTTLPSSPSVTAVPATAAVKVTGAIVLPLGEPDEAAILADSRGQWAASASASSEYAPDRYSAIQATGAPNVDRYADHPNAWCHSGRSVDSEWLEVGFANPVRATEVRIRQTYVPGTLARIEAFGDGGEHALLWEGTDPHTYPSWEISWFVLRFPETDFPVSRVRLTLNVGEISGWKQIDAVQLVGSAR